MFLFIDQPAYHTRVALTGSMWALMLVMSMLFTFRHSRYLVSPYTGTMLLICKLWHRFYLKCTHLLYMVLIANTRWTFLTFVLMIHVLFLLPNMKWIFSTEDSHACNRSLQAAKSGKGVCNYCVPSKYKFEVVIVQYEESINLPCMY